MFRNHHLLRKHVASKVQTIQKSFCTGLYKSTVFHDNRCSSLSAKPTLKVAIDLYGENWKFALLCHCRYFKKLLQKMCVQ